MNLLMPFVLISLINTVFDFITLMTLFLSHGLVVLLFPIVWSWLGCLVCEGAAAYHGWHVTKALNGLLQTMGGAAYGPLDGGRGMQPGQGGYQPPGQRLARAPQPQSMGGPYGPLGPGPTFTPFSGQGH